MNGPRLLLVAGEASGDLHGGNLLRELKGIRPELTAYGVGGEHLQAAGLECLARSEELSHMGLAEVLRELPRIRRILKRLVVEVGRRPPRVAVLIDSPDFNLRLANHLGRQGITVVLYVSPQLWAWRSGRVRAIRRRAREVLCVLPFEVPFYREHGVAARHVGHPLIDDVAREGLLNHMFEPTPGRLALLPGSRAMEVRALLPAMLEGMRALPQAQITEAVLLEAPGMAETVDQVIAAHGGDPRLRRVRGAERRGWLARSAVAWTASGTATLECALLGVPMVVGYRLHPITFLAARLLVRVADVALVNLIAGRRVVPELIQQAWSADNLIAETRAILADAGRSQRTSLAEVRERLGGPGASWRAAQAVAEHLQ